MSSTGNSSTIPSKALILIALLQGLALFILHQSIEFKFWPNNEPQWLFAFYALAVAAPIMLLLGLGDKPGKIIQWTAIYSAILFGLGFYIGHQAIPLEHIRYGGLLAGFVTTLCVATFKALMYTQHFATGDVLSYSRLFRLSWRNFLTLGLALLFTLCTWGVLMLWAGLFKAIKVDFFYDLFNERWFYYPALALANGFGVLIFRSQAGVIDTITRIQQALMKFLLVILSLISVSFLLTLPFTGLAPLWETGGSTLILWMQALMLFFINAVYQDDPESQPYHLWLHRLIYLGVALLPIYSAISFYGLSLRVDQYGWSLARCWAFLLWGVFAAFSFGYLWGILRLRDRWLHQLSWVNVRMGLLVLGLMLLVNSPMLDFRKISVASQMERLESGEVSLSEFDYRYFRYDLARPGYDALQELKQRVKKEHPEILVRINSYFDDDRRNKPSSTKAEVLAAIVGIDESTPTELLDIIHNGITSSRWKMRRNQGYQLFTEDLNGDGEPEYILADIQEYGVDFTMYNRLDDRWEVKELQAVQGGGGHFSGQKDKLLTALKKGEHGTEDKEWRDLTVGGYRFRVP
ncbi:DUF4153 domain-containing protein [Pseudoteredinibacter isoporae]|uniref:DUF4153 domain-containing protein n=1 Tax=Pseudoteredinibacter isoporae TaxID=570281 RepID=A0A7X0JXE5_9GAMM|nr:DUF4153 domain-containing protein [Pseudoteredinibacter isoporae]MBB6523041.1 hypothetical protein [Pseudoteredinibacter isoporae]NHO88562.1 DUF4153 domain-containing protein [Pseudoteredinibacter isoporae]NIB22747.1 DUF4153 domain-containing protein [Pseudoteredinibacter isoporae]